MKRILAVIAVVASFLWVLNPGLVAAKLTAHRAAYITALLEILPFLCLFFSLRWSLKLSGRKNKLGQQAIAWIVLGYSTFLCVISVGAIVLHFARVLQIQSWFSALGVPVLCVFVAYSCRQWLKRLAAQEDRSEGAIAKGMSAH